MSRCSVFCERLCFSTSQKVQIFYKFGEYCKFDHEVFEKGNNEEIIEIRRKLEELKSKIKLRVKRSNSRMLKLK